MMRNASARATEREVEYQRRSLPGPTKIVKFVGITGVLVEVVIIAAVTVVCLYFQVIDRPTYVSSYRTNDPSDTIHGGAEYACGCELPPALQIPENPFGSTNATLNRCYARTSLETVTILMFQNVSAGATVGRLFKDFFPDDHITNKTVTDNSYILDHEAHDIVTGDVYNRRFDRLYPNGRETDILFPIDYILGPEFLTYPMSYQRVVFTYNCTDCRSSSIEKVNKIFSRVASDEKWATCFPWGNELHCNDGWYEAKCLLYPTESMPANFALKQFFRRFLDMDGISRDHIYPIDVTTQSGYSNSCTSFQPNSVYLNVSWWETGNTDLGFVEVEKGSAFWISVLKLFPEMDNNCSSLRNVSVCSGTSACNVFASGKTSKYELECLGLANRTECINLMAKSTVDHPKSLLPDSLKSDTGNLNRTVWNYILCGPENRTPCVDGDVRPYLVQRRLSPSMTKDTDSLNEFLYRRILRDEWAQVSGICTNTFEDVYRHPPKVLGAEPVSDGADWPTMFLESQCNASGFRSYCWLTGRYHNFTDGPEDDWKQLDPSIFPDQPAQELFVCYRIVHKGMIAWSIVIVGIVFGWIGTVHLICACLWWVFKRLSGWSKTNYWLWRSRWWPSIDDTKVDENQSSFETAARSHALDSQVKSPAQRSNSTVRRGGARPA